MINSKMYRYKIHDDTDVILMAGIDEFHQFFGSSVAGGRTEESGVLISPGFITWMFAERHNLNIIVIIFFQIRNQDIDHFHISIPVVCFFRRLFK